jgi:hypothetical protein
MPNYSVNLFSLKSIKALRENLTAYRDGLNGKCKELVTELARKGIEVAETQIKQSPLGSTITLKTTITEEESGCKAILIATGEIHQAEGYEDFNTLLAVEFGAGIHFNQNEKNPKAEEFGLGVGTFPGQVHAFDPGGWYYWDDENQKWQHSYGVKATMPMYSASQAIIETIRETARTVFGN